ncbi:hypothetical protein GCM10009641_85730 [Mycobacterium cookii]|uniref:Uncharacterized protein n=1 Tax=Nocardioides furvisabuli TaxID=375542 RepID=A0ABP5J1N5_9ACTN
MVSALAEAADAFAARAHEQEVLRDRARPGTMVHHHHAHSATLWRSAEGSLRARIGELGLGA